MYVCLPVAHTYNDNVLNMIVHSVADNKPAKVQYVLHAGHFVVAVYIYIGLLWYLRLYVFCYESALY